MTATALPVLAVNIPARFKARAQWALKRGKVPHQPNGRKAKSTDPTTWTTFETVWTAYAAGGWDGLYYAMTPDDGVGIDEDHCVAADGTLTPEARTVVNQFNTYAEYSPSGDGLRLFLDGSLEQLVGRKKGPHECYNHARFLSITGQVVDGIIRPIAPRQAELDAWHLEVFGSRPTKREPLTPTPATRLDDQEILAKVRTAKNADKFAALFDHAPAEGDTRTSEDDLALADMLAFYTQDPAQLRRLLEASARRRDKWYTRRGARDWLDAYVVDKALSDVTTTYSAPQTWDGPSLVLPAASGGETEDAGSPAIMARLAWLEAELERERARRAQAEALNSSILRGLANPYLRNEMRLIVAEVMDYAKALRCGRADEQGLVWLYIGSKEETGLAGQTQMSPRTISRQLHRHATYEIDGLPLVELHEDEVEGSDGNHRTRIRYKVPFLEQGGTIHELIPKVADYEPPGVETGERQAPGGDRGHCDCGGALKREITISKRVQRLERSIVTCMDCGTVTDEGERVTHSETHVERVRDFRLDLPDLPRSQPATTEGSPAIMAGLPAAPSMPAAVEDEVRATPCPAPATEPSPAMVAEVPSVPLPRGPALPPGFTHWCPGAHQFPVPLPSKVERCSGCTRTWRPAEGML
jgi:hypothetical protein